MQIVEACGDARTVGRITGEATRQEIREHLEAFPPVTNRAEWDQRKGAFVEALRSIVPLVYDEMQGMAEGAACSFDDILALNCPLYNNDNDPREGCTNIAFASGPDGPVWGKNNDGYAPGESRPPCGRLVRRKDGIPLIVFTFCGMVATTDGMNAEGLAMGHSSVGSIYQQSDHFVPIRLWAYECMMRTRTVAEFLRHFASRPTRDKGYSILCVDAKGAMCSIEAPCPVMQVRYPPEGARVMNCVNYYQLPHLWNADRRTETGKLNAIARRHVLDNAEATLPDRSVASMQTLLRHHGDVSICRHGGGDGSHTEYSMIGIPAQGKVLYCHGYPCREDYSQITF